MTRSIGKTLVGLLLVGLAGCSGVVGNSNPGTSTGTSGTTGGGATTGGAGTTGGGNTTGGAGTTGGGNTTGSAGTTGGGGNVAPGGTGGVVITVTEPPCAPGVPATSQFPRLTTRQYDTVIADLLGITTLASAQNQPPSAMLAPDSAGSMTDGAWTGYQTAAEKIAAEVMAGANKSKFITCDPAAAGAAGTTCLENTIKAFGRKAFRRPVTPEEVTSFMRFNSLTPKGTPAEVSEAILLAILSSPYFIMLPELAEEAEGSALKLNSHEVAARLSFLIWNSVPDDVLNIAADAGQLLTKEQIRAQALRLLQSGKAGQVASTFHELYADMGPGTHWVNNTTHAAKFTNFTPASYTAGIAEIDSFFQDVVLTGGKFGDLFTSNVGFVTNSTAALYGLAASGFTATPKKTTLDTVKRPGFLTRVGFLSTFSHGDSSSPILRGAFITGRVLGIPTGTPDPSFLNMMPPPRDYMTNREATEALTNPAPCNACHATKVNPPGFVLERYDSVGAWQDNDQLGGAINSMAEVYFNISPEVKKPISTPAELMAEIAATPKAQRNYARYWVAFATGRAPNANDTCIVDSLAPGLNTNSIASMMADYTQADSFRLRTIGN